MPLYNRDYIRGNHPPTCTCEDCCEKRLKRLKKMIILTAIIGLNKRGQRQTNPRVERPNLLQWEQVREK